MPVAGTFAGRQTIGDDFELIPTPGHTPGTTAFLWDSGTRRFLFTGDMLWIEHGRWSAVVLGSSDRTAYLESLELIASWSSTRSSRGEPSPASRASSSRADGRRANASTW